MATIKDIAREAGVSITTVSRALNGYSDVNEETRKHIKKVAQSLGYVPNKAAQNLVKKENKTLAIIISELFEDGGVDNIVYRLLSGVYSYAQTIGYEVMLFTTNSAYQHQKSYVDFCKEHNIAGAVISGIRTDDPYYAELVSTKFPCVLVDGPTDGSINSISIDSVKASQEITELLIKNGHTNIACIAGRKEAVVTETRLDGYKKALLDNNIEYLDKYVKNCDFLEETAYIETTKLIKDNPEITALFCQSDVMAVGAMKAIKDLGKKVPKDISIAGFDDIPVAAYTSPSLTTVQQNFYEIGIEAAKGLLEIIEKKQSGKRFIVNHKIIERKSISYVTKK